MRRRVLRPAEVCGPHNIDLSPQPSRFRLRGFAACGAARTDLGCFCCGAKSLRPACGPQIFRLTFAVFSLFLTILSPKNKKCIKCADNTSKFI